MYNSFFFFLDIYCTEWCCKIDQMHEMAVAQKYSAVLCDHHSADSTVRVSLG